MLAAWALALLVGVFAGRAATDSVEHGLASRRAEVHPVSAVLTEDAARTPRANSSGSNGNVVWSTVRWTAADGATHTGEAKVEPGSAAGASVTVWTDGTGGLVSEPATAAEARTRAELAGVLVGLSAAGAALACGRVVRAGLDRRRMGVWDAEWARVGPRGRKRMAG